jgi:hypothetical protein
MERLERAADDLAAHGWSMPMFLTPAEVFEILDAKAPTEIDARFVDLYETADGGHFARLAQDLLNRDALSLWRVLLDETISAYRRREFTITVPALLTICEGVFMRGESNRINLRAFVQARARAELQRLPGSIHAILWRNVHRFVEELFKRSDFSGDRPSGLNRHWILHGRDAPTWSQADSLRLFQAVDTLSSLVDDAPAQQQA